MKNPGPEGKALVQPKGLEVYAIPTGLEGSHGTSVEPATQKIPEPLDLSSASLGHPTLSGGSYLSRRRSKRHECVVPTEAEGSHYPRLRLQSK